MKPPKYLYFHHGKDVRCSLANLAVKNKCFYLGSELHGSSCFKCKIIRYERSSKRTKEAGV